MEKTLKDKILRKYLQMNPQVFFYRTIWVNLRFHDHLFNLELLSRLGVNKVAMLEAWVLKAVLTAIF